MTSKEIQDKLKTLLKPNRYQHSLGVMQTAEELAVRYSYDPDRAAIAGLVHDCARDLKASELTKVCIEQGIQLSPLYQAQPELLHGPLGARLIYSQFGINDPEIQNAVRVHTTGCENMSLLDKIVFLADYIEPYRSFPGVELVRETALHSLDEAVLLALTMTILFVLDKHEVLLHPDTIQARNYLLLERKGLIGKVVL